MIGNRDHCGITSVILNIFCEQNYWWQVCSFMAAWAYETSCISELGELTYGQRYHWIYMKFSANGHCTASQHSDILKHIGCSCYYEPTKKFIINFLFLGAWKLLKIMLKYYLCLTLMGDVSNSLGLPWIYLMQYDLLNNLTPFLMKSAEKWGSGGQKMIFKWGVRGRSWKVLFFCKFWWFLQLLRSFLCFKT